jgi:glycosyltransferase involved in cell wall biosynthesis
MTVSVLMITYNHSKYIKQAVESILEQKTNFNFELIIANDCATDNTDTIIDDIIKINPNGYKIKYFSHKKNLGMMPNFIFLMEQAKGVYCALCEGDDYWTDNYKLQKQVNFLDENLDYSICFHNVQILTIDGIKTENPIIAFETSTIKDLARGNYIHTPSVMYRNHLIPKLPDYFKNAPVGDYFLHMLNAKYGKIKYIDENMAVYRVHETSYWSSKKQSERELIWIGFLKNIQENFSPEIQILIKHQINSLKKNNKEKLYKKIFRKLFGDKY